MASAAIFVGWGSVIPGREAVANQVFNEAVHFFAELQQRGEIESFEPLALEPHGGDLAGCMVIRGDREKLSKMRFTEEFQRIVARGQAVVLNFGVVDAHIGEDLQRYFEINQQSASDLT